jgi:tRNA threonylcarbamoyladenosine biosynthesis protein TsaB
MSYPRPVPEPLLVLAVDTATPAVTAALVAVHAAATVEVLAARVTVDARRHGELLAPSVSGVLTDAGRSAREVAAVVAGVGPGPFTGLRVGLVTAAALSDALGIPAYGVCSLDALARPASGSGRRLLAAIDARRREVYWAGYDERGERLAGPCVDRPAELAGRLGGLGLTAMCGAGARAYAGLLGLPLLAADYPDAAALVEIAADRVLRRAPADPLTPLYLRRPDAVEPGRPKAVTPA